MAISPLTVVINGTTATPTGGTSLVLTSIVNNGTVVEMKNLAQTDTRLRQSLVFGPVKEPKVSASAPNGYTQLRIPFRVKVPKLLANGKYTDAVNVSGELFYDLEATDAEKQQALDIVHTFAHQSATKSLLKDRNFT